MTTTAEHAPLARTGERAVPAAVGELRALTGLRIVAAGWVVLFHFHFTALPGVEWLSGLAGPVLRAGALGVDLFFVLSGFVIAHTYLDRLGPRLRARESGRFVWARACRIWPAYVLVLHMFGVWLVARAAYGADPEIAFQGVQPTLGVGDWLQQVLMVQLWDERYFDGASWVGSAWSISAEWLAYLLFPAIAVAAYRMRNLPVVVLATGAVALMLPIALAYAGTGSPYYPWSWLVRILCGFGGGVLAHLAVRTLRAGRRAGDIRRIASTAATALPVLVVGGLVVGELAGPGRGGVVIVLFPVLVGALALAGPTGLARLLSTRMMVHGGRISYALYLIHIPMFEVFWLAMRRYGGFGGSTLLAPGSLFTHLVALGVLLGTLPAAHLLFRFVEEPARAAMLLQPARWVAAVRAQRGRNPTPGNPTLIGHTLVTSAPVGSDEARRDPETCGFPPVRTPVPSTPVPSPPGPPAPAPLVPAALVPTPGGPDTGPRQPVSRQPDPTWQPVPATAPAGTPSAVPAQRPVDRVVEARRAEVRSAHPALARELAEELVGARPRGRHRMPRDRTHIPHIAGQRGPKVR